ncbi:MAG: glycosyl transferase group 1 [Myxococcales bacterium]|nr:glycosyl transferase group 1 [Myxococcales bacterium]
MKIGYLVPEFPSQTHIFFWREVQALRAQGVTVQLISTRRPDPSLCRHEFAPAAAAETHYLFPPAPWTWGVPPVRPGQLAAAWRYGRALSAAGAKLALRRLGLFVAAIDLARYAVAEGLEHIHVHSCADAAHVAALSREVGGPPYSLTLHGDLTVYGSDHGAKMRGAAFVDAVGTHLLNQIVASTGTPRERVHVTCMGVDLTRLRALGAERAFAAGALHVVTVARLNAMKGHHHAIAAVRRAVDAGADLRYTIAGEGEQRATIETQIRSLRLEDRVQLVGTLAEGEVFRLLSTADAFVLPSIGAGEAWPVSLMEAMGAGLPVISSIIGATPEMVVSGDDGILVEQGDEGGLSDALGLLARDVGIRRKMGERARATAEKRFDVQATAGRLVAAIRDHASAR